MWRRKQKNQVKKPIQTKPTKFPSGLAVETETGKFLIKGKSKYKFYNDRVYKSWKLPVSLATDIALKDFIHVGFIGFRDGSLIKDISDGKIYLVSENKTRHITNPDVFIRYGLLIDDIIEVSNKEVKLHKVGEDLD